MDKINRTPLDTYDNRIDQQMKKKHQDYYLSLRKEKMFKQIMMKRISFKKKDNEIQSNSRGIEKDSPSKSILDEKQCNMKLKANHNQLEHKETETETYSSTEELLYQLNQAFETNNNIILLHLLDNMNQLISKGKLLSIIYDKSIVDFVLKGLFEPKIINEPLFFSSFTLLTSFTFNSQYITNKLNSVSTLNMLIDIITKHQDEILNTSLLTLIGNISIDCGNDIIRKTSLLAFLCTILNQQNTGKTIQLVNYKSAIFWNLYLLSKGTVEPNDRSIIRLLIPLLSNEIELYHSTNNHIKDEQQINLLLSVIFNLSNDNEMCQSMIHNEMLDNMLLLFNYLFMSYDEIKKKNILVLNSLCISKIIIIFHSFLSLEFNESLNLLSPKFTKILSELIKLYRIISHNSISETDECYSSVQLELMNMIELIADINKDIILDGTILKILLVSYSKNNKVVHILVNIINKLIFKDTISLVIDYYLNDVIKVVYRILIETYVSDNVKIGSLEVLLNMIKYSKEIDNEKHTKLINELQVKSIVDIINHQLSQSQNQIIIELCNKAIEFMNYNEGL